MPTKKIKGKLNEPMLLLRTDALPDDRERWQYELKVGSLPGHCLRGRQRDPPAVPQRHNGQEFVIGGYTRGTTTFDALIFGASTRGTG